MKAPPPITPERLAELSVKANAGQLSKADKDEIVLGHTRLALQIANGFANGREYLADDIESEALLALVEAVEKAQGKANNLAAWIKQVIRNKLSKLTAKEKSNADLSQDFTAEEGINLDEEIEDVCRDELDKEIFKRRYDGMNDTEVSEHLKALHVQVGELHAAGRTEEEIAVALDIPVGLVAVNMDVSDTIVRRRRHEMQKRFNRHEDAQ